MAEFKFLITTDNHMGFKHDDKLRRKDSFMAFAETLQIARERDVDFILLGGDLFHTNKPNAAIEHKCIKILRQHMNAITSKPTTFKRISGEFSHFERVKHGNFEDPGLSVPYPIFTIHGNHDDPTGPAAKSVCEKLATCGLLNYFGKVKQLTTEKEIVIEPIVLQKDNIKIALYGIGFIPDKKLCTAFRLNYVNFKRPPKDAFNVLVVHQNRLKYDEDKYIPDSVFPTWFHLIIRGHEHDAQQPEPIPESKVGGLVYQPGSTVATSIEMRESAVKQCGLVSVKLNDHEGGESANRHRLNYEIIDLRCYRKMLFKDIYQKEVFDHIKANDGRRKLTPNEYRSIFRRFVIDKMETLLGGPPVADQAAKLDQSSESSANATEAAEEKMDTTEAAAVDAADNAVVDAAVAAAAAAASGAAEKGVYKKLSRFDLPLLRVRLEFVNKTEVFDDAEINAIFHPSRVANRDIIKFRKQRVMKHPDGRKINVTFSDELEDSKLEEIEEEIGQVEAIDLSEERKDTIDTMIMNYFQEKPESERLTGISLDEYTEAVNNSNEDGNVIAKVLSKKRNAVLHSYKTAIRDDETAKRFFTDEAKIHKWFLAAFKGKVYQMEGMGTNGDDEQEDKFSDDDEEMNNCLISLD